VFALAFDHRHQFEELAARTGTSLIAAFKVLIADAAVTLSKEFEILASLSTRSSDATLWTN